MATLKVLLFTSKVLSNGESPIMIRLTIDRKSSYISIGHTCNPEYWNFDKDEPNKKHPNKKELDILVLHKIQEAKKLLLSLESDDIAVTLDSFKKRFIATNKNYSFNEYISLRIEDLIKEGRVSYANSYKDLRRILSKFHVKALYFNEVNHAFLSNFEKYMNESGLKPNTQGVYFRNFRAIYNHAVTNDYYITKSENPFQKFKVSQFKEKTQKRALKKEDIEKIIATQVPEGTMLYNSKFIFLFSYYCWGINFQDIALLQWSDVKDDVLTYSRSKTSDPLIFRLIPPAIAIIQYFKPFSRSKFVFPILNEKIHVTPLSIDNRLNRYIGQVNKDLKEIAKLACLDVKLTTYVARHTFATVLKRSGVSTSMISSMMGHETEKVTQTYLDSFESDDLYQVSLNLL
jgi:site-specific recombinase XerD